jgi:hypothetical protein
MVAVVCRSARTVTTVSTMANAIKATARTAIRILFRGVIAFSFDPCFILNLNNCLESKIRTENTYSKSNKSCAANVSTCLSNGHAKSNAQQIPVGGLAMQFRARDIQVLKACLTGFSLRDHRRETSARTMRSRLVA